jgi:hypothetical protein
MRRNGAGVRIRTRGPAVGGPPRPEEIRMEYRDDRRPETGIVASYLRHLRRQARQQAGTGKAAPVAGRGRREAVSTRPGTNSRYSYRRASAG